MAGPKPEELDTIILRLKELSAQEAISSRSRTQILVQRQIEDTELEQSRKAEDDRYNAGLGVRAHEDERRKGRQAAEDQELERVAQALNAQEDVRSHPLDHRISD